MCIYISDQRNHPDYILYVAHLPWQHLGSDYIGSDVCGDCMIITHVIHMHDSLRCGNENHSEEKCTSYEN